MLITGNKKSIKYLKKIGDMMKTRRKRTYAANVIMVIFFVVILALGFITESPCSDQSAGDAGIVSTGANTSSNIQQLIFSAAEHPVERNLVRKHERIKLKTGQIYIALADLNDDGTKEIISYIHIFNYCGQETGCPLNIYRIVNGKLISLLRHEFKNGFPMFIEIDKTGKQNAIGILSSTTMGWHDILIKGETVWKWHGSYYKR